MIIMTATIIYYNFIGKMKCNYYEKIKVTFIHLSLEGVGSLSRHQLESICYHLTQDLR